jgi:oligopeptide transport system ATP-binding protein
LAASNNPLIALKELTRTFSTRSGILGRNQHLVYAVNDVSLSIEKGETLGLVGESGSGKSTLARLALRLIEPTSGTVEFEGNPLGTMNNDQLLAFRRKAQMVFQDPYSSLNPRLTVSRLIGEGLDLAGLKDREDRTTQTTKLLEMVGLSPGISNRYPHEFSGGQRQRIGIARALAAGPEFIAADEPVSALDVSVQAQVLNLLLELQISLGLTMLFVAHDLAVVRHISDRVAVMYLGRIVELADSNTIYTAPLHPYTRTLLEAIPVPDPTRTPPVPPAIESEQKAGTGCLYASRCPYAVGACNEKVPELHEWQPGHFAACIRANEI